MKRTYKKILSILLPIPLLFAITFCCCLSEHASAETMHASTTEHRYELDHVHHSEHHHHSDGEHECSCPKHLSLLSEPSYDFVFHSSFSQMMAKNFMAIPRLEETILLSTLLFPAHGPPQQDRADQVSLPIFLRISNLRI